MKPEKRWTHTEIEFLHESATQLSIVEMMPKLGRSAESIREMLSCFRLTDNIPDKKGLPWSDVEKEFIKQNWATTSLETLSIYLSRTQVAIVAIKIRLNLDATQYKTNSKNWTEPQIQYLVDHWGKLPKEKILQEIGRSFREVRRKASQLNLPSHGQTYQSKRWTVDDQAYLQSQWNKETVATISQSLNRSKTSIYAQAEKQGLIKGRHKGNPRRQDEHVPVFHEVRPWTEYEIQFLYDNYSTKTVKQIAVALNRTPLAVQKKIHQRDDLRKSLNDRIKDFWTDDEKEYLSQHWGKLPINDIAITLGKSFAKVKSMSSVLGLPVYEATFYELKLIRWTPEATAYLVQNYRVKTVAEIAAHLNIPAEKVQSKIYCLRYQDQKKAKQAATVKVSRNVSAWTAEEEDYLINNWATQNNRMLADNLNRSRTSVIQRGMKLGLKRTVQQKLRISDATLDDISDVRATKMITQDPGLRYKLLSHPEVLGLQKAMFILKRKINISQ